MCPESGCSSFRGMSPTPPRPKLLPASSPNLLVLGQQVVAGQGLWVQLLPHAPLSRSTRTVLLQASVECGGRQVGAGDRSSEVLHMKGAAQASTHAGQLSKASMRPLKQGHLPHKLWQQPHSGHHSAPVPDGVPPPPRHPSPHPPPHPPSLPHRRLLLHARACDPHTLQAGRPRLQRWPPPPAAVQAHAARLGSCTSQVKHAHPLGASHAHMHSQSQADYKQSTKEARHSRGAHLQCVGVHPRHAFQAGTAAPPPLLGSRRPLLLVLVHQPVILVLIKLWEGEGGETNGKVRSPSCLH